MGDPRSASRVVMLPGNLVCDVVKGLERLIKREIGRRERERILLKVVRSHDVIRVVWLVR